MQRHLFGKIWSFPSWKSSLCYIWILRHMGTGWLVVSLDAGFCYAARSHYVTQAGFTVSETHMLPPAESCS